MGNVNTATCASFFCLLTHKKMVALPASLAAWRADTPFPTRAGLVCLVAAVQAWWVWVAVAPPIRPAKVRFAAALPVLASCCTLWAAFDPHTEIVARALSAFSFTWLGIFKVLGLILGRGPLSPTATGRAWSPAQFAFILTLPVSPRYAGGAAGGRGAGGGSAGKAPTGGTVLHRVISRTRVSEAAAGGVRARARVAAGKAATLAVVVAALEHDRTTGGALPAALRPWCYLFGLYTFLGLTYDAIAAGAVALPFLRLDLSPHFDHPFLATSFADLWGRRWNLIAGHSLRFLIYEPIVEGRLVAAGAEWGDGGKGRRAAAGPPPPGRPSPARRAAALLAAFAASGAMHEVLLAILTPGLSRYTGWWMVFFTGWAGVLAAERRAGAAWAGAGLSPIPAWLAAPLTVSAGIAAGQAGFVTPAVGTGLADRVVASLRDAFACVGRVAARANMCFF